MPPANALIAFECAARHGSFTLAARELRTSQSAVSRHINQLETWLSVRLFERSRAGATLTAGGERFRDGVAAGLAAIRRGAAEAAELASAEQVVIACSHDASHSLIMRAPRRPAVGARRRRPDTHPHRPPPQPEPAGRPRRRHPPDLERGRRRAGEPGPSPDPSPAGAG